MSFQKKSLEGVLHYVVPAVLLVGDNYFNGSSGRSWYGVDLLLLFGHYFSGVPICAYHPSLSQASYISAQSPEVFESYRIGRVFNARVENKKLVAELWIDPERARIVDERVLTAILKGEVMEVSTGQFNQVEIQPDGALLVTSLVPDHVAILPDQIGACSIKHGCGMGRT